MIPARRFFAAEIAHAPNTGGPAAPWGSGGVAGETILRASDIGYRTDHPGASLAYPPTMLEALTIDRRMNLDPASNSTAAAWGRLRLANDGRRYDEVAIMENCAGRNLAVLSGFKTRDASRGYWMDPPNASVPYLFKGVSLPWSLTETTLDIPVRDMSWWLEKPIQQNLYTGAGGLNGHSGLTGVPKPKARGGMNPTLPIRNVSPVLIDPTNRIYQYNDAAGTVVNLYEGGALTIAFQADVADLYVGSTTAGRSRTNNARGLFQLGSTPVNTITVDVTGQFPIAGAVSAPAMIAKNLLLEDCLLPPAYLDAASFVFSVGLIGGIYFDATPTTGVDALSKIVGSIYSVVFPKRDGTLSFKSLPDMFTGLTAATWTENEIVSCVPRALPAAFEQPWYRVNWGWAKNYTVQTSGLNGTLSAARLAFLAAPSSYATQTNTNTPNNYKAPIDAPPVESILLQSADASTMAFHLLTLWSNTGRRCFDVTVPIELGLARELGQNVAMSFPVDRLGPPIGAWGGVAGGAIGFLYGEQLQPGKGTITFQVVI